MMLMKKILFWSFSILISFNSMAQKKGDSKIIVTVTDTINVYEKVRLALVEADFVVKELNSRDSIVTYPRDLKTLTGVAIAYSKIKGTRIELTGLYVSGKTNYFGSPKLGKDTKAISYYKGSKLWPLLVKVANRIGGEIEYMD
jgi:hypothetical protein